MQNYLFFETTQGYHYRSFDSLLGRAKANTVSPTTRVYRLQPVEPNDPIGKRMTQIKDDRLLARMNKRNCQKNQIMAGIKIPAPEINPV